MTAGSARTAVVLDFPTSSDVTDEVHTWLVRTFKDGGIKQYALASRLSAGLGRNIHATTVHKMLSGQHAVAADEMLVIARIFRAPLPSLGSEPPSAAYLRDFEADERRAW